MHGELKHKQGNLRVDMNINSSNIRTRLESNDLDNPVAYRVMTTFCFQRFLFSFRFLFEIIYLLLLNSWIYVRL